MSASDSGVEAASVQASALLLWGTGAELAVAGAGDGAGGPLAGSGVWVSVVQVLAGSGDEWKGNSSV
ncbi:MAG: hypothetical protein O3B43_06620 [Chloroflexi bacterium]|nr:hypothetical protein [Chloroflexota bacterium]